MKKVLKIVGLVILVLILTGAVAILVIRQMRQPPARQVFINGSVLTMDQHNSVAEAIAVENDQITAIGSTAEIKKLITNDTVVNDLEGRTLIPGFVDAHSHFPGSGLGALGEDLNSPPIGSIVKISQIIVKLKARAEKTKKGEWVYGFGYDDTLISEKRHLTRFDLDKVSTEHPVFISHISGHLGAANTMALKTVGIVAGTPNPEGGIIRRDKNGDPDGVLEEKAKDKASALAMKITIGKYLNMLSKANQDYAEAGVTTAQNGLSSEMIIKGLSFSSKYGLIPLRLVIWPNYKVGDKIINGEFKVDQHNSKMLKIGAVKLIADGSIQGYTGYLSKPYFVPFKGDKEYRGYPVIGRGKLVSQVKKFHNAGQQLAIHGNGDACIDNILYAYAEAQKEYPRQDTRHILVHAQMTRNDQLDLIQKLGVVPSFYSAHTYYWGDRHRDIFMGPERAMRMSPAKSALDRGIRFTIHLDTPVVPMNPLLLIWSAVNRISSSGKVIGKAERISKIQALRATTIDSAWQMFLETTVGSIEPGKYADLVILSEDPLTSSTPIRDIKVLETFVGGRSIYKMGD